jgi:hypothetical protein
LEIAKGASMWAADGIHLAAVATNIAVRSPIAGIESSEDVDPEAAEPEAKRKQRLVQRR